MKRSVVLWVLMCCAALGAYVLKPTKLLADQLPPINLEAMVPKEFGDWRAVPGGAISVVNPQQQEAIEALYTQVLERVYVNGQGYRIMLTVAYGRDQSDHFQAHKPEVCYPAQGFQLHSQRWVVLDLADTTINGKQLVTQLQQRHEPVTYWHVVGSEVTKGGFNKKMIEMQYAIQGVIPDGMLVRASSINPDAEQAHFNQQVFLRDLLQAIPTEFRPRFGG